MITCAKGHTRVRSVGAVSTPNRGRVRSRAALSRNQHHVAHFFMSDWRSCVGDPSVWIGVRQPAVQRTAAFWLMHCVRSAIPQTNPLARCEFATLRERLIKIGARVIEHIARIRVQLPTSCPEGALFRAVARGLMRSGP
jgi:hypothetical protein